MEEIKQLRLKEKMLKIELEAVMAKIKLYDEYHKLTTVTNVPESESLKTKANPEQTVSGKDKSNPLTADALLKSMLLDPSYLASTSKLVNDSTSKESSSPVANGSGKDNSNPLSPVALGKSKMTVLSKNKSVLQDTQEFRPDYLQATKKNIGDYYVIYNGPHKGIYTDEATVSAHCEKSKETYKKFESQAAAKLSFSAEKEHKWKFSTEQLLRPKLHQKKKAVARTSTPVVEKEEGFPVLSFGDFRVIWSKARAASQEDFITEKFFTSDKQTKSLFNFVEGADSNLVYLAFQAGLVKNIYPSSNLQELKYFPSSMVAAIKNFRTKVLRTKDDQIYINVTSSIPDWQQDVFYHPYYLLEIGLAKSKRELTASKEMDDVNPNLEDVQRLRIKSLRLIVERIFKFTEDSKVKVNYAGSNCVITSWCPSRISKEDINVLCKFQEKFMKNRINASVQTRTGFCRQAASLFEDHYCNFCNNENSQDSGTSTKCEDKKESSGEQSPYEDSPTNKA